MEILNLIISIISMIGTVVSAVVAFIAKSEVKKLKNSQFLQGNNNNQFIIGDNDGKHEWAKYQR